ncbi:unnamed protein product [Microthlaspi erraticum]|uniref:Uncharacterized protein n=1 Tax=Microthlaspi erraticum TaxID=1685480 RepID=A0A6D2IGA8_9BRAS|nr:unnamed protein product [Microthlaspi erraticum]
MILSAVRAKGEFEIGVNIPHEENDDSQVKKRVKRSIKRLRRVSMRAMRMCPWKRRSQVKKRMSSPYVELVLKNMHLAKLFSTTWNPTRSSLASSSFNEGEKRMVTFRQLGDLVWVQLWRGNQVELQGKGTPKGLGYNR